MIEQQVFDFEEVMVLDPPEDLSGMGETLQIEEKLWMSLFDLKSLVKKHITSLLQDNNRKSEWIPLVSQGPSGIHGEYQKEFFEKTG